MTKEVEGPIAPHGPFTCEIVFHMTDGENEAKATFDAPVGRTPDEAGLAILAGKALAAVRDQLGDKWRLMQRDEFVQSRLSEQAGVSRIRFAVPTGSFSHAWAQQVSA